MTGLKLKLLPQFPSLIIGGPGIDVEKINGNWHISLDYSKFPQFDTYTPGPNDYTLIWDSGANQYKLVLASEISQIVLPASIISTPSSLTATITSLVGDLLGTFSVVGGSGVYTFSLTFNPSGYFSLSGTGNSQLRVATVFPIAGNYPFTVSATNGTDTLTLASSVTVTGVALTQEFSLLLALRWSA
jgi:hypothetical protein